MNKPIPRQALIWSVGWVWKSTILYSCTDLYCYGFGLLLNLRFSYLLPMHSESRNSKQLRLKV